MNNLYVDYDLFEAAFHVKKFYFFQLGPVRFFKSLERVLLNPELNVESEIELNQGLTLTFDDFWCEINRLEKFCTNYEHEKVLRAILAAKLEPQRLVQIFQMWIYWLAIFPQSFLDRFPHDLLSIEKLIAFSKSVLGEKFNLNQVFEYETDFKTSSQNIYESMQFQPNTLTRLICSQDSKNVRLLIEHGYDFSRISFRTNDARLESAFHWAHFCDNGETIRLLSSTNIIKLNQSQKKFLTNCAHKKSFRICASILQHLNNDALVSEYASCTAFENEQFSTYAHDSLLANLYKSASENEIKYVFEKIYEMGFSQLVENRTFNRLRLTQFVYCLGQQNIKKTTIDYLIGKLVLEITGKEDAEGLEHENVQKELIAAFFYFIRSIEKSCLSLIADQHLTMKEILLILESLLRLINRKIELSSEDLTSSLINQFAFRLENSNSHLFDTNEFKLIDLLLNYRVLRRIEDFDCLMASLFFKFNRNTKNLHLFSAYIFENDYIRAKLVLNWHESLSTKKYFKVEHRNFILNSIIPLCKYYVHDAPRSLKFLAKNAIRNKLASISDRNIEKLGNLPLNIRTFLKEPSKANSNKIDFYTLEKKTKMFSN